MGYSTRYKLTSVTPSPAYDAPSFESCVRKRCDYNPFEDSSTWYEHEADIAYAMRQSGATFVTIHGEGEEPGDIWDKEFAADAEDGKVRVLFYRYALVRPTAPTTTTEIKETR